MKKNNETPFYIFYKVIIWPFKSFFRILAVVLVVSLYIYQSVLVDDLAMEFRQKELIRARLLHENSTIQAEIDQLTNINRIEKMAKEKFELVNGGSQMENLVIKRYEPDDKPMLEKKIQLAGVN